MVQHEDARQDADDAAQERPDPVGRPVREDPDERQGAREEPVEAEEGHQGEDRRPRIAEQHEAQQDSRDALQEGDPPDGRVPRSCERRHHHSSLRFVDRV